MADEDDGVDPSIAWPRKGDTIFGDPADPYGYTRPLLSWARGQADLYLISYRRAVGVLYVHLVESKPVPELVVFPFVTLWRHTIELIIKTIAYEGWELFPSLVPSGYEEDHNLLQTWNAVKPLFTELSGGDMPPQLEHVDVVVAQLHELDPSATGFRYFKEKDRKDKKTGQLKKGKPTLEHVPDNLDLAAMNATLEGIYNFFEISLDIIRQKASS